MKQAQGKHERESISAKLRIIWAIAAKDLLEALKNKNTIAVILTSLFVVFAYRGIPILTSSGEKTAVLIHDAGNSTLFALLENNQNYRFYAFPSEEAMKAEMGDAEAPELAISIPQGFDQVFAGGWRRLGPISVSRNGRGSHPDRRHKWGGAMHRAGCPGQQPDPGLRT